MAYELRRYGYAPLGDGEYEVVSCSSDILKAAYEQVLDAWRRGEGRTARYYIWDTEAEEKIEVDDIGVEVEPSEVFVYAIECGGITGDDAKSLASFLGLQSDDYEVRRAVSPR